MTTPNENAPPGATDEAPTTQSQDEDQEMESIPMDTDASNETEYVGAATDNGTRRVRAFWRRGGLAVTARISAPGYGVTHLASGYLIAERAHEMRAIGVALRLLALTDWTVSGEEIVRALRADPELHARAKAIQQGVSLAEARTMLAAYGGES